jgi:hypothetical protein
VGIWYILWEFGILCGNLVYFVGEINATLSSQQEARTSSEHQEEELNISMKKKRRSLIYL